MLKTSINRVPGDHMNHTYDSTFLFKLELVTSSLVAMLVAMLSLFKHVFGVPHVHVAMFIFLVMTKVMTNSHDCSQS